MTKILIAGVDEAGRGPLVGPVVAGAVILDAANPIQGLADSKKLSEAKRETLAQVIKSQALAWSVAFVDAATIDEVNILQASLLAMKQAVESLEQQPGRVLVDGNRLPAWRYEAEAIVKGDSKVEAISAASILAKVARDAWMLELHREYPGYGFDRHKGYPTRDHMACLQSLGICPHHRRSFRPVRELIETG